MRKRSVHAFMKGCAVLLLVLLLPALAQAWYVSSKVAVSGEGTINPSGNKFYTNGTNSLAYSVTPATGFTISRVTIDGINTTAGTDGKYVVPYNGKSWRYIVAYFAAATGNLSISVNAGNGGGIREANGLSLTGILPGANRSLLITPNYGYQIGSVTASNATAATNPDGTQTVSYTNLLTNQSVSGTFVPIPNVTANAGPDVYTQGNGEDFAATLNGSQSSSNQGAIAYTWSGPAELVFATPNAATTTVYANTAGTYTATLTINSGDLSSIDTAQVNIPTRAAFLAGICSSCHTTRNPDVMSAYDASQHILTGPTNLVSCQTCHNPTGTAHYTVKQPTDVCQPCHVEVSAGSHGADASMADRCAICHNAHSGAASGGDFPRHFDGAFGGNAQYVSHGAACGDCHADNSFTANAQILNDFAATGHADVASPAWASNSRHDWPQEAECRRCHTRVGFVNDLNTTSTLVAAGEPGQILACNACHTSVVDGALRTSPTFIPGFTSTPHKLSSYPDSKDSNICIRCHSGRNGGSTIWNSTADFNDTSFINSHFLAAAETIYQAAYEFAGLSYGASLPHKSVGEFNGGPCIHCHMFNTLTDSADLHSFRPVTKDADGTITAVIANCTFDCHGSGNLNLAAMNNRIAGIGAALNALKAQLAAKGIHYSSNYPYFFTAPYTADGTNTATTDWNSVWPDKGKDVMGAAFNLNLLLHEPGAYAHNQKYAQRLIYDSIDFLNDGIINANVDIDPLVGDSFSQATADLAKAYLDSSTVPSGIQRP